MYYNANGDSADTWRRAGLSCIGMAVSNDMVHWKRWGRVWSVMHHPAGITGDAEIQRRDVYVMFYFGFLDGA